MTDAADVDLAVRLAVDTLSAAGSSGWDRKAGTLDWTCWETVEHLADDLFAYAVQLGSRTSPLTGYVPFEFVAKRPGGPANMVYADRAAGPAGLLQVLEACGVLLSAMVRVTPSTVRAYHPDGVSDPAGFAAMGVVETLVHTDDVAAGLGVAWTPPDRPCAAALSRLFPNAPTDTDPWPTLLWATGRGGLPGHERLTSWRWDSSVHD